MKRELSLSDVVELHVKTNFNRSGGWLKSYTRKRNKFKEFFRYDVDYLGGGVDNALRALAELTLRYDNEAPAHSRVLSVQFPFAQLLISGGKELELRKQPPPAWCDADEAGAMFLLAQSKTRTTFEPHPDAVYGGRQDARILGQITLVACMPVLEEDLTEELAVQTGLTLSSLRDAWAGGYRYGWVMSSPVPFTNPPCTYDKTTTEGSKMGTIFTGTKEAPIRRIIRLKH